MIDLSTLEIPEAIFRNEQERQLLDAMVKDSEERILLLWASRHLVEYNPETGDFFWRQRKDRSTEWNRRHAGKRAGSVNSHGYVTFTLFKKTQKAHRLAWLFCHGEMPNVIDHINGVRTDNRICNLRNVCDHKNRMNAGIRKDNTSGVAGVKRAARGAPGWRADIKVNRKTIHLGTYSTVDEAIIARRRAEERYFGEYRRKTVD